MLKYEQYRDHGKIISDVQQTDTAIYSCLIITQTHRFTIKFNNNSPQKVIEFRYAGDLIRGLNIITFNFPLKNCENSKLISKSYWFVMCSDQISLSRKIFEGHPNNIFSFHQKSSLFIGEMKNGKKEGFGELRNHDFNYIGMFHNDEFSGNGVKSIKEGTIKYKGSFQNSKFHGNIIKKKGRNRKIITYDNGNKVNKNPRKSPANQRFENSPGLIISVGSPCFEVSFKITSIGLAEEQNKLIRERQSHDSINSHETEFYHLKSGFKLPLCYDWLGHEINLYNDVEKSAKNDITQNYIKVFKRFDNGDVYNGMTLHKRPHGFGVYQYNNRILYKGEFFEGKREGIGAVFFENTKVVEGRWKSDMLNGIARVFQKDISMKCYYNEGKLISIINITMHS